MSILDNLKNVLKHDKQMIPESLNIQSSDSIPSVHIPESIYEEPIPSEIAHNIQSKQTFALSYLCDMAYVAATADNGFYLPKPFKTSHFGREAKNFNEKFNADVAFTKEYFKKNIRVSKKLDAYVNPRKELYDLIRTVYPDFCRKMEDKVPQEDYEFYRKNKTNLKKCLNCDRNYHDTISSHDVLLNYQDNLAKVIDTLEFSKACKIEDTFVASEINIFLEKLAELPEQEKRAITRHKIKLPTGSVRALDFTNKLLAERNSRIEKYSSIEELYKKMNEKQYVKFKLQNPINQNINKASQHTTDDSER